MSKNYILLNKQQACRGATGQQPGTGDQTNFNTLHSSTHGETLVQGTIDKIKALKKLSKNINHESRTRSGDVSRTFDGIASFGHAIVSKKVLGS